MAEQSLSGIRVLEFGGFAAGPVMGKHLADHGAEVIRIESRTRPDGFRTHYPPFKDNQPGLNRSGLFALCNNNKYSITLNLKTSPGVEIVKRLVARADIVVENFTPGTMARLTLDYESLQKVKPDLIMLSTCNQGQTGPHAGHPGFGSHLSSLGGFTHLIGYPEGSPLILYGPYIDYIAVAYGVIAVLAALDGRRRTGKGQYIDLAQYETGLQFLAPALLDFGVNGRVTHRVGNCHPTAAPHGAYPCRGEDRWCTISIWSDAEWRVLCRVLGDPSWARDARFSTVLGRKTHEGELDQHLTEWTRERSAEEVMRILQAAGIPAGVVKTMKELFDDPQLRHREIWRELPHPEIGPHHYEGPPFHLSRTEAKIRTPAPTLGEHNAYVYGEILGMSSQERAQLQASGVFE